ncbi:uncharacterized protein LOC108457219 isoform X2 [Gossypium arboreum]|uniref:uncharacterized protein LOC108457219 isoform X2 n=1 Tax=Gossypium arboreum TaxID=29729 RepID=UPI0022F1AA76|nr:uncharacterized protein LOC108457219 isoform X2 [Gossypium arboreum]
MELTKPTKLEFYDQMLKLQSKAILVHYFKGDDGRKALILDNTIFHPQGGGQPSDTGFICVTDSNVRFCVQDVRSKDGVVFHYGVAEDSSMENELEQGKGKEVILQVDESRRRLNSRPFVEYKGTVPLNELQNKQREIEIEVNALISKGGKVYATVLPYQEAAELCGGSLPDYIHPESGGYKAYFWTTFVSSTGNDWKSHGNSELDSFRLLTVALFSRPVQGSNPRIIKLGDNPGCPCGGTHVSDISEILSMKVSKIRTKKGMTKVFYTIGT